MYEQLQNVCTLSANLETYVSITAKCTLLGLTATLEFIFVGEYRL